MGKLDGRVALVTGGAGGQGASHAEFMAREGAKVIIADINEEKLQRTAQRLQNDYLDVEPFRLDVRLREEWIDLGESIQARHGLLDVLVNNAGMMTSHDIEDVDEENWRYVIDVNQTGQMWGMQTAIPLMRDADGGSIINISSTFAIRPPAHGIAYAAAKGAVLSMTKNVAMAVADEGIRVNSIIIPMVDTPFLDRSRRTGSVERRIKEYPLGRIAVPADISSAVVFLASDDSRFMTGSEMTIDGGVLSGVCDRYDDKGDKKDKENLR